MLHQSELCADLFLALDQRRHLQLQPFEQSLLRNQRIIQRLQGVILESQATLQLIDTRIHIHSDTLRKTEMIG